MENTEKTTIPEVLEGFVDTLIANEKILLTNINDSFQLDLYVPTLPHVEKAEDLTDMVFAPLMDGVEIMCETVGITPAYDLREYSPTTIKEMEDVFTKYNEIGTNILTACQEHSMAKYKESIKVEFEKVSFEQYLNDWKNLYPYATFTDEEVRKIYDAITVPKRAFAGSAGYDFILPFEVRLAQGNCITVPTGIRCKMPEGMVLLLFPRSGQGCKHRLMLNNTAGVIDADYYGAKNEGHILIKVTYQGYNTEVAPVSYVDNGEEILYKTMEHSCEPIVLNARVGFAQGLIVRHEHVTDESFGEGQRTGGFGSTDKK